MTSGQVHFCFVSYVPKLVCHYLAETESKWAAPYMAKAHSLLTIIGIAAFWTTVRQPMSIVHCPVVQSHVDIFSCTVVLEYADPSMSVRNKLGHGVSRDGCACFPACHAAFFNFAVLFRVPAFLYKTFFCVPRFLFPRSRIPNFCFAFLNRK